MCDVVKFVVATAIPPQHRLASSSNSLLIQLLWSLDTFIQICPLPFMALTHQSFNIFSSAPGHFHTQELQSHFVFTYGKVLLSENSSLVLDQITFSKMTTFEMPFEIMLYKEKNAPVTTYALSLKPICIASLAPRMSCGKAGLQLRQSCSDWEKIYTF